MANVTVTMDAANFIRNKLASPDVMTRRHTGLLPRLKWASSVSLSESSGKATELGPRFFFSWTPPDKCKNEGDLIVQAAGFGTLALAPGARLATQPRTIDVKDDHLVLSPPIANL